jgi:glutamyl-tRNA reductase
MLSLSSSIGSPVASGSAPAHSSGRFFVVGITHQTAPLAIREKLALNLRSHEGLESRLAGIRGLRGFVALMTCNRAEIYGLADDGSAIAAVERVLTAAHGFSSNQFNRHGFRRDGREAIRHLIEVAAGFDSQIVGENEIFGQVKKAYARSQELGHTSGRLNRIFQRVFQAAKDIRRQVGITQGSVSLANLAVEFTAQALGDLACLRVLVLGAGDMGARAARAFRSRGVGTLTVASRRSAQAIALASEVGASHLPFEGRDRYLGQFDVVAAATSAGAPVVGVPEVLDAMDIREGRKMALIDFGLPRNIDPAVGRIGDVFLCAIEALSHSAAANREARLAEMEKGRARLDAFAERIGAMDDLLVARTQVSACAPG